MLTGAGLFLPQIIKQMPKVQYEDINFRDSILKIIAAAEVTINEYMAQGYKLALRQLYYQFVR